MTLYLVCDDNVEPLRYSLAQPNRRHILMDGRVVTSIRKVGHWIQFLTVTGWVSANGQNIEIE